ncbi:MAG: hypothetical protein QM778_33210 [Myxococcales bacterium]
MGANSRIRRTKAPNQADAQGSFTTAGAGAVTVNQQDGVKSITRTNVGEITIVFEDFADFLNFCIRSVLFTTDAQRVFVKSNTPGTGTVVLQVVNAGGSTPADTTGMRIDFECDMRSSRL